MPGAVGQVALRPAPLARALHEDHAPRLGVVRGAPDGSAAGLLRERLQLELGHHVRALAVAELGQPAGVVGSESARQDDRPDLSGDARPVPLGKHHGESPGGTGDPHHAGRAVDAHARVRGDGLRQRFDAGVDGVPERGPDRGPLPESGERAAELGALLHQGHGVARLRGLEGGGHAGDTPAHHQDAAAQAALATGRGRGVGPLLPRLGPVRCPVPGPVPDHPLSPPPRPRGGPPGGP